MAEAQTTRKRPAEKIMEGLREAVVIARGDAIPARDHTLWRSDLPPYKGQGQQLYTIDGRLADGPPDAVNRKGYPSRRGRRLYTAEHLSRRGMPVSETTA